MKRMRSAMSRRVEGRAFHAICIQLNYPEAWTPLGTKLPNSHARHVLPKLNFRIRSMDSAVPWLNVLKTSRVRLALIIIPI